MISLAFRAHSLLLRLSRGGEIRNDFSISVLFQLAVVYLTKCFIAFMSF